MLVSLIETYLIISKENDAAAAALNHFQENLYFCVDVIICSDRQTKLQEKNTFQLCKV